MSLSLWRISESIGLIFLDSGIRRSDENGNTQRLIGYKASTQTV